MLAIYDAIQQLFGGITQDVRRFGRRFFNILYNAIGKLSGPGNLTVPSLQVARPKRAAL
jgi:hypothetical protein